MQRLTFIVAASMLCSCTGAPLTPVHAAIPASSSGPPIVGGCQVFPANNPWNTDISQYPLDKLSAEYIAALPGNLHPDFGQNPDYGIPLNNVPSTQKKV